MRKFIIYSQTASTAPKISDLKAAGRIDIILHSIISAMFASHTYRTDVELHLILMGPPNSPRHITIRAKDDDAISKKNLKKLIEVCLRKAKKDEVVEVQEGVFVDDKTIDTLVKEFTEIGDEVFVLDECGKHIKDIINKSSNIKEGVFILGDYDGFDKKTKKFLKKNTVRMSLGEQMYFTSQSILIINYELDNL